MCDDATQETDARQGTGSRRMRRASWILALLLLFATAYQWHPGGGWNVMTRIALVRAVYHDHTLSINRSHHRTGDKAEYPPGSGIYYSDKPVGGQVLGLPAYAVGYSIGKRLVPQNVALDAGATVASWFSVGLPTIVACLLMLDLFGAFGLSPRQAAFITLAYALGTLAWPYSTVWYGHQAAAAFGFIAFWFAGRASRLQGRASAALTGLFAGWALITEFPALIIAGVVFLYVARLGTRAAVSFVLGSIPFIALQLLYNHACFGSPLRFGYMYEVRPEFAEAPSWIGLPKVEALWGITFSANKGIFVMSPFLLFAVWGLWRMIRSRAWRAEGVAAAAVFALYMVYNASHFMWEGGTCFGPRHIVPMLPFLCIGLGFIWPRMSSPARLACGVLTGVGILVMFAAVNTLAEPALHMTTGGSGPLEALARLSLGSVEWPTFGMLLGLGGWKTIVLHGVLIALPALWLWRVTSET